MKNGRKCSRKHGMNNGITNGMLDMKNGITNGITNSMYGTKNGVNFRIFCL